MIILLIFAYLIVNFYVIYRSEMYCKEIKNKKVEKYKIIALIIYLLLITTPLLGYIMHISSLQKVIQKTANTFVGILFYIFITIMLFDVIMLLLSKFNIYKEKSTENKNLYLIIIIQILIIFITSLYGFIHAKKIYTKTYNIEVNKKIKIKKLKIALISDIHLGYNATSKKMEKITNMINSNNPDIIFIVGDIFDNDYKTLDNVEKIKKSLAKLQSKYGKYAVYGNHDIDEKLIGGVSTKKNNEVYRDKKMDELLKKSGIKVLEDESILIDNDLYIIGRKDASKTGEGLNKKESIDSLLKNIDGKKMIIVLEHEPIELENISNYNVDLVLSGHTHKGQFFPLTLGTYLKWENPYGYIHKRNTNSIVTSGVGVYGPNMRIGSNNEICIINVNFKI